MTQHKAKSTLFVILCLCCFGPVLFYALPRLAEAQVLYGTIVGNVKDPSNAVIPGAVVSATSKQTNVTIETLTNDAGQYTLTNLLAGTYTVKVAIQGFKEYAQESVLVTVNTIARVDVTLEIGARTETVTVTALAAQLQTDKADVHKDLSTKEITNLPLNMYRNYQSLIDLVPGANPSEFQNANVDTPARALTTNINGVARFNNNTRLDGALNIMPWLPHHSAYVAPQESIQTVNITTNSFDAEQGLAGGAAITVQSKSGSNEFHGVAFEYHRNSALGAKYVFTPEGSGVPKSLINMFGGNFGGPIKKDKLFFFANFEAMRQRQSFSRLQTVAPAELRRGDFSATGTTIYDPATGTSDGRNRVPFTNGIVPASRISSITAKMYSLVPLPNVPGATYINNYYAAAPEVFNRDNYDFKVDWVRSSKNTIWAKYSLMNSLVDAQYALGEAGGPGLTDGGPGRGTVRVHVGTIGGYYAITPRFMVDANVGMTRYVNHVRPPDYGVNFGLDVLGIPGTNGPDIRQSSKPIFSISNYATLGLTSTWIPVDRWDYTYTATANVNWSKGRHDIRFGPDVSRYGMNHWQPESANGPRGYFAFSGGPTTLRGGPSTNRYNSFANYLLGLPTTVTKSLQYYDPMSTREWQQAIYFRDRWQATSNLTINLGLRWEHFPLMNRGFHGIERYDPEENKMYIGGYGGVPRNAGTTVSWKLWAPRVGIAYRFGKQGVIRTGYGITFDPYNLGRPMRSPYPVVIQLSLSGINSWVPVGPIANGIPPIVGPDYKKGIIDIPGNISTGTLVKGLYKRGYVQSWNFTYEREFPGNFVWSIGYVATRSIRIVSSSGWPINNAPLGTGETGRPLYKKFGRTVSTSVQQPWINSIYDSLQTSLDRRFTQGLMMKIVYTWSHSIESGSSPRGIPELFYLNRGSSSFDRRHNFRTAWIYEMPFGPNKRWAKNGVVAAIAGGWQINGIFSAVTGTPFGVSASGTSLNTPGSSQTADQVLPEVKKLGGIGLGDPFYDRNAFAPITEVRFGNTGNNILNGPGIVNLDFGIFRRFQIGEGKDLEFRAESANLTNTPHFSSPSSSVSDPATFMYVTSARQDQRTFRFGLRISF